jgi:hypothetical protein
VTGLLDNVDPRDLLNDRLQRLVRHLLALQDIEDFLDVDRPGESQGAGGGRLEQPSELVDDPTGAVLRATELLRSPGEHHRVPTLVADLGPPVPGVRTARGTIVNVPQEHLHEDSFEPDADAVEARQLVLGQLDPLLLAHPVP